MTVRERFESKYRVTSSGCWEWVAARSGNGYGAFAVEGRMRCAHRVAFELYVGEIPVGLELDHLCSNKACVNPAHLEPVTHGVNVLRAAGELTCPSGHPRTPENTRFNTYGYRVCIPCARQRTREWGRRRPSRRKSAATAQ